MNDDQCKRLEKVEEMLVEVVLRDADPANWSAPGVLLCDMTKDQRGDAQWCRKTAVQTVALLNQVTKTIANYRQPQVGVPQNEPDPDAMIRDAEAKAGEFLKRVASGHARSR